jgi:hypothetical protein
MQRSSCVKQGVLNSYHIKPFKERLMPKYIAYELD